MHTARGVASCGGTGSPLACSWPCGAWRATVARASAALLPALRGIQEALPSEALAGSIQYCNWTHLNSGRHHKHGLQVQHNASQKKAIGTATAAAFAPAGTGCGLAGFLLEALLTTLSAQHRHQHQPSATSPRAAGGGAACRAFRPYGLWDCSQWHTPAAVQCDERTQGIPPIPGCHCCLHQSP